MNTRQTATTGRSFMLALAFAASAFATRLPAQTPVVTKPWFEENLAEYDAMPSSAEWTIAEDSTFVQGVGIAVESSVEYRPANPSRATLPATVSTAMRFAVAGELPEPEDGSQFAITVVDLDDSTGPAYYLWVASANAAWTKASGATPAGAEATVVVTTSIDYEAGTISVDIDGAPLSVMSGAESVTAIPFSSAQTQVSSLSLVGEGVLCGLSGTDSRPAAASVGGVNYETFAEAVAAGTATAQAPIVLYADASAVIAAGATLYVNANGHTFTATTEEGYTVAQDGNAYTSELDAVYVAQIGATKYASLAEAVAAAQAGDTIELIADDAVSLTNGQEIEINKSLTIIGPVDANVDPLYTIYGTANQTGYNDIFITGSGTVTLSNLNIEGFGSDAPTNPGHAVIYVSSYFTGTVNLDNLNISQFNRGGLFLYGGTFNVTDCEIDCANSRANAFTKGIEIKGTATGVISGCDICNTEDSSETFSSAGIEIYGTGDVLVEECAIYSFAEEEGQSMYGIVVGSQGANVPSGGSLTVTDTWINVPSGALVITDDGTTPVSDYTIAVDGDYTDFTGGIAMWAEDSVITIQDEGSFTGPVYVEGGTIEIESGYFYDFEPEASDGGAIAISGGYFDTVIPEEYCAAGFIPATTPNEDDLYTVIAGYKVTFVNYDGAELFTTTVAAGETAAYEGATPVKPGNASTAWVFTGWNPAISAVTDAPQTYTAQFEAAAAVAAVFEIADGGATTNNYASYADLHAALEAGKASGLTVVQLADIDLAGVAWTPVMGFAGVFDGNGKVISNLTVNAPDADYVGLFGKTVGAGSMIKNVTVMNATVTGRGMVGAVVGELASSSTISNVRVTGLVKVSGNYKVGGIAGVGYAYFRDCAILGDEGSFVKATYLGTKNEVANNPESLDYEGDNVGGIAGHVGEGSGLGFYDCTASGLTVTGTRKIGGMVGTFSHSSQISNASVSDVTLGTTATLDYANGNKSTMHLGGIVGSYFGTARTGTISGTVKDVTILVDAFATGISFAAGNVNYGLVAGGSRSATEYNPENLLADWSGVIATGYDAAKYSNDYLINDYVAIVTDTQGNFVGGYESLFDAVAAAQAGDTVELLADVEESLTIRKDITVTGAFTITGTTKVTGGATVGFIGVTLDGDGMIYALDIAGGATVGMRAATVGGGVWCNVHVNGATLLGEGVTMLGGEIVVAADGQTFTYHGETLDASEAPWGLDVTQIPGKTLSVPFMDIVRENGDETITLQDMTDAALVQAGSILYVANMPGVTSLEGVTLPSRFGSYSLKLGMDVGFLGDSETPTTGWAVGNWNEIIDTGATVLEALDADSTEVPVELTLNGDTDLGDEPFEFRYSNLVVDGGDHALSGTIKYTDDAGTIQNAVLGTEDSPLVIDMTEVSGQSGLGDGIVVENVVILIGEGNASAGTVIFSWDAEDGAPAFGEDGGFEIRIVDENGQPTGGEATLTFDLDAGVAYIGPCEVRLSGPTHAEPVYTSLASALAAAQSGDTVTLLADVANIGTVSLPAGVTLDGDGHTVSGDSAVSVNVAGGTIRNVSFEDIHNASSNLSAVYATGSFAGTVTITGCTFADCDWDAIQATPVAGATIVITGNTFSDGAEDGVMQQRFVHIQSAKNVDFSATVTDNVMLGSTVQGALEAYYFADPANVTLSGNYIEDDEGVCLLQGNGANVAEMMFPRRATADDDADTLALPPAAIKDAYNAVFYDTFAEAAAVALADATQTVTLYADASLALAAGKSITIDANGNNFSASTAAEGYEVVETANAGGSVTYTAAKQTFTITWYDEDGETVLATTTVEYGKTPTYTAPAKESANPAIYYTASWTPTRVTATADASYTVVYTENHRPFKVGDSYYAGSAFKSAYTAAAAGDGVVEMVWDATVSATSLDSAGSPVVIAMNGHTIRAGGQITVRYGATVTFEDGAIERISGTGPAVVADGSSSKGSGRVVFDSVDVSNNAGYTVAAQNGGSVIVSGASTIESADSAAIYIPGNASGLVSSVTVRDNATVTGYTYGIAGNGSNPGASITVSGGTVSATKSDDSTGIFMPGTGTLAVSGGTVTGRTGIEARAGEITVSGGTISGTASSFSATPNGSGSTVIGAGIAVSQHTGDPAVSLVVTGGEISGMYGVYEADLQNSVVTGISMSIVGGEISGTTAAVYSEDCPGAIPGSYDGKPNPVQFSTDASDYCDEGYETVLVDGWYIVDALEEAELSADDIVLIPPLRFTSIAFDDEGAMVLGIAGLELKDGASGKVVGREGVSGFLVVAKLALNTKETEHLAAELTAFDEATGVGTIVVQAADLPDSTQLFATGLSIATQEP